MKKNSNSPRWAALALLLACAASLFKRYLISGKGMLAELSGPVFHAPGDFSVYFLAWQRVKAGVIPYVLSDGSPYKYSPSILGLIGLLPADPKAAWLIFGGLSLVFWVLAILMGMKTRTWDDFGRLVLGLMLSWKGVLECLDYGQMEFLLFFLAVAGANLFFGFPFWCGFLLGFLPAFKLPWIVLFVPFFVKAVERRAGAVRLILGYGAAWVLWIFLIPVAFLGADKAFLYTRSWMKLLQAQPYSLYVSDINQSFLGAGLRAFTAPAGGRFPVSSFAEGYRLTLGLTLIFGGILLGILLQRVRRTREFSRDSVLAWGTSWILFGQLVNPLAWRWGSVFVVGAPSAWGLRKSHGRREIGLICCIAALWALQQNPVVRALGFSHWTDLHPFNLVTLYWLGLLLL